MSRPVQRPASNSTARKRQEEQAPEDDARQTIRERLYVALVEQRVIDSRHYGEPPYAPITWEDVDRVLSPGRDSAS